MQPSRRGSRKPTPAMAKVYELLADGEWHKWDYVMSIAVPLVPPADALRRQEGYRVRRMFARGELQPGDPVPPSTEPEAERIKNGAREILRNAANAHRHIEFQVIDGVRMVRWNENGGRRSAKARTISAGRPAEPHTAKIYEILSDGNWHDFDDVVYTAMRLIHPGKALRFREAQNRNSRKQSRRRAEQEGREFREPTRQYDSDIDAAIMAGRRGLMVRAIRGSRRLETRVDQNGRKWIRMYPEVDDNEGLDNNVETA